MNDRMDARAGLSNPAYAAIAIERRKCKTLRGPLTSTCIQKPRNVSPFHPAD